MLDNWHVLQVTTGKENYIKNLIEKQVCGPINVKLFQRELVHSKKGKKVKVTAPLFPGYLFVQEKCYEALQAARKHLAKECVWLVCADKTPCRVHEDEMELLLQTAAKNGVFELSHGLKVNDKIEIIDGALKNLQGNILWIDEKKQKARVKIFLLQRNIPVNLGIEILKKVERAVV